MYRFTRWDKGVSILFVCDVLVLSSPWRLIFYDTLIRALYEFLPHAVLAFAFVYALVRSKKIGMTWPWRTFLFIGSLATVLNLMPRIMFFRLPVSKLIGTPYIKADDAEHKVLWIHNHGYLHNWNTLVRVIEFRGLPFFLETDFEEADLNGAWRKYSMVDPESVYEGTAIYKDGQVIAVIESGTR